MARRVAVHTQVDTARAVHTADPDNETRGGCIAGRHSHPAHERMKKGRQSAAFLRWMTKPTRHPQSCGEEPLCATLPATSSRYR
jgi:hypothetical protein